MINKTREEKVRDLMVELIDKMLEKYEVNYNYILIHSIIEGKAWFEYFTFTVDEDRRFKEWALGRIRKVLRLTKKRSEAEYGMFNMNYGLRIVSNEEGAILLKRYNEEDNGSKATTNKESQEVL